MKYFLITSATDKKETGVLGPQCMVFPKGYNLQWYEQQNSMTKLNNGAFPQNNPDLLFELDKKANLTDFISQSIISARGFLINEKVKNIFKGFLLPEHKFFQAQVCFQNKVFIYYWLHLLDNNYSNIDYSSSKFYEGITQGWKNVDASIQSLNDIVNFRKEKKLIFTEKLILNGILPYDIFLYSLIHQDIFVSEKLVQKLIQNKITGYKIYGEGVLCHDT